MTETEKQHLLALLEESQSAMLAALESVSEEAFCQQPVPESWSVAEVLEHVTGVETGVIMHLQKLGKTVATIPFEDPPEQAKVLEESASRAYKAKSPKPFLPTGRFQQKSAALDVFIQTRKQTIGFVRTHDFDLKAVSFPHQRLGMYNGENWLAFIVGHCQRHVAQISAITQELSGGK